MILPLKPQLLWPASLHALGGLLTAPMFFAHSRELYHCIMRNHGHCTSGSFVGTRPSTYAIKLSIWTSALVAARVASCTTRCSKNSQNVACHTAGTAGLTSWHTWASRKYSSQSFRIIAFSQSLFLQFNRSLLPLCSRNAENYTAYDLINLCILTHFLRNKSLIDWHWQKTVWKMLLLTLLNHES